MEEKVIIPYAPLLVESIRSIGYSFESAVADIIDNSISAAASSIYIRFSSKDPQKLSIQDNGCGMSPEELENAMRYGSKSSLDERSVNDLGRFGLGLKTASLSQCRKLTVITKKDGKISAACWDLDYIVRKANWSLQIFSQEEIEALPEYNALKKQESGTIVTWENFDRLKKGTAQMQKVFDEKIASARDHIALVFHRFLYNAENISDYISIYFNGEEVKGIDPFLTRHPATQPLSEQILRIGTEAIYVKPYVLPHISKLKQKDLNELGGKDEFRQKQGFYIYRNKRLIIWGTWFRLIKFNELGKLARIRVDIPNSLDDIWEIDIKKSTASLPHFIKKNLINIVENTIGRSERVYKYRGRNLNSDQLIHIWSPIDNRGKFSYQINPNHPIIKMVENHLDEEGLSLFNTFIRMLEDTFPYADIYYRMAKNNSTPPENTLSNDSVYLMLSQLIRESEKENQNIDVILSRLSKIDTFSKYPDVLEKIKETYRDDR